jgi:hypothetical protein
MRLGHEKTIVADSGNAAAAGSAAMDSDEFANASSAPDFCFSLFTREFQILRRQPDRNKRKEVRFVADARPSVDDAMAIDSYTVSESYLFADYGVRPDRTITANLGA